MMTMTYIGFALAALLALATSLWPAGDGRPVAPGSVEIALDDAAPAARLPLPPIEGSRNPARPLVVIDAGHGGRDPGSISPYDATREKNVTLPLAVAIRDALAASGRVRVALTRADDRYLALRDRYEIARRLGADLFVSVHADAAPSNDQAHGATIYTLSEVASDREAALLASRENQADVIGGARMSDTPEVNHILIDLAQRESMNVAADFARLLHREGQAYFPFRPQYHRFASLIVLKAPDIPSILFESGYLTNRQDAAYITSDAGRRGIAEGMRRAIEAHFARRTTAPAPAI